MTNSGHLRPLNAWLLNRLPDRAVVALMFEAWEIRPDDIDLETCFCRHISVVGVNERHPAVDVFSYLGPSCVKQLHDCGIAVYGSRIALLCDNDFAACVWRGLSAMGAEVDVFTHSDEIFPAAWDAVVVAMRPRTGFNIGEADAGHLAAVLPAGAAVVQFWGDVDRAALAAHGLNAWPSVAAPRGHMGILLSAIGPEPIVRLQAGGLRAAELVFRRLDTAVNSGIAQVVTGAPGSATFPPTPGRKLATNMMLTNKRVLVTGGAGFVASHIVDLLVPEGCREIVVVDNMVRGRPENLASAMARGRVRLINGDIRDRDLMGRLIAATDVLFHQAALRITHCAAEPQLAREVMVDATFDLFAMCAEHKVERVVAASSASVYGMAEDFPTSEKHHPYNDRTLYGAAKLFNEGVLRCFNDMLGLEYVALRYFNVYGPRMDIHGKYTEVLIRWMERIEDGSPPVIFGDGLQTMDFVHVKDVARANILAAKARVSDAVFNIGCGTETSLIELATALAKAMGRPHLEPEFVGERAVNPVSRRLAGISAARNAIAFEPSISLEEGLRGLVDWWRRERKEDAAVELGAGLA